VTRRPSLPARRPGVEPSPASGPPTVSRVRTTVLAAGDPHLARLRTAPVREPLLLVAAPEGPTTVVWLPASGRLAVGRAPASAIALTWDEEVSRLHALVEVLGEDVVLHDPGYSSNGTLVDGRRVRGSARLRDGSEIRVGRTRLLFRCPGDRVATTVVVRRTTIEVTPAQQRVLHVLCGPLLEGRDDPTPTNAEIAGVLGVGEETVKTHLARLYRQLPDRHRVSGQRERLARLAVDEGLLGEAP
jgi:pSer/pThr/pTyr-binding forkhead associated (FHA) protein